MCIWLIVLALTADPATQPANQIAARQVRILSPAEYIVAERGKGERADRSTIAMWEKRLEAGAGPSTAPASQPSAATRPAVTTRPVGESRPDDFGAVIAPTGTMYHSLGCPLLPANDTLIGLSLAEADAWARPCGPCFGIRPPAEESDPDEPAKELDPLTIKMLAVYEEQRDDRIKEERELLNYLKQTRMGVRDRADLAKSIEQTIYSLRTKKRPVLPELDLNVGSAGTIPFELCDMEVFQVLSPDSALFIHDRVNLIIKIMTSTENLADGDPVNLYMQPMHVKGTTTYTTALGTSKTVYVLEHLDPLIILEYSNQFPRPMR